jgi:hypothetical protein
MTGMEVEAVKKKLEVKETKEKPIKERKVRDYTDMPRELAGLVKENYITGFQPSLFILDKNLKEYPRKL